MRQRISDQLLAAITLSGLSLPELRELLDKRGFKMTRSTLWKRLHQHLDLSTDLAEEITDVLRRRGVSVVISWPPRTTQRAA